MNSVTFVVFMALCVAVALADEPRSKKEVGYNNPYVQNTDLNKYLAAGGYDHAYYSKNNPAQSAPYYPNNQPQNYNYYQPQPYQPYPNGHQLLGYQQYNGYPYNNANPQNYYGQHYNNNYQHYPNAFGYPQNAYGHFPQGQYEPFPVRQAPIYPSPGAQPVNRPVPHPFYHQQGVYYPPQLYPSTTEANRPTNVYPHKN